MSRTVSTGSSSGRGLATHDTAGKRGQLSCQLDSSRLSKAA